MARVVRNILKDKIIDLVKSNYFKSFSELFEHLKQNEINFCNKHFLDDIQIKAAIKSNKFTKYTSEQIEQMAMEVLATKKIFTLKELVSFLPISMKWFSLRNLNRSRKILDAIDNYKAEGTHFLKAKWMKSKNAVLQLAVFKLICEPEDRARISMLNEIVDNSNNESAIDKFNKLTSPKKKDVEKLFSKKDK